MHLLLPHLVHAPALRHLTLRPICNTYYKGLASSFKLPALVLLLTRAPQLHCTARIQQRDTDRHRRTLIDEPEHEAAASWKQLFDGCKEMKAFDDRFQLICSYLFDP